MLYLKRCIICIGPINVLISLIEVIEPEGPHLEIETSISSTVEGVRKVWRSHLMVPEFDSGEEHYTSTINRFKRMETD